MIPKPVAFATPADFRAWLERYHAKAAELLIRLYKVRASHRGTTYAQALDEAADSFSVRFTPRRPKSKWSLARVRE